MKEINSVSLDEEKMMILNPQNFRPQLHNANLKKLRELGMI